ncbi:MAG: hypothetical protein LBF60_10740 [Treponema sp.]|jgi:hypothetical protein|nr:hypothetical protein [Treponema sp.]
MNKKGEVGVALEKLRAPASGAVVALKPVKSARAALAALVLGAAALAGCPNADTPIPSSPRLKPCRR